MPASWTTRDDVPIPHPGHVGDGVEGPRLAVPDPDAEVAGSGPRRRRSGHPSTATTAARTVSRSSSVIAVQRAGLGIGRVGGTGANSSGDLFLAFATGNAGQPLSRPAEEGGAAVTAVDMLSDEVISGLFEADVDATEEAIVNALVAADTMTGRDRITAFALPHDRLRACMRAF